MPDEKTEYTRYQYTRKGADRYNAYKKILYGEPDELVEKMFMSIFPYVKNKTKISILDIGGGDGKRLKQIMDLLGERNISARATLVEPSKVLTDDCQKAVKEKQYDIKVVKSLFEDFKAKEKFELILMLHSYFSFRGFPIFKKMKTLLAKGGVLFIAGNDEGSFMAKLKRITGRRRKGSRNEIDFVFAGFEKQGFKFEIKRTRTQFENCLKGNTLTKHGKIITSWIALSDYAKIPLAMKKEITELFQKESRGSRIEEKEIFIVAWK